MDYFYDGQVKRYLTQFMRLMSNFSYKDARGNIIEVPIRYGDMTRQVASILKKNSENTVQGAPFISCYIKDLQHDRNRMQDPTFISKISVRERDYDEQAQEYLNTQGPGYTIERLMPTPYLATFNADIWTTNTDQKLQIWEQITVFFNPSLELQSSDNYIDWSSLSVVELVNQVFESRSIPQGLESDISIATLTFNCPIWINPPAKVKKLGIVTKIITSVFASDAVGQISATGSYNDLALGDLFNSDTLVGKTVVTPGNFGLLVLNNTASLIYQKESDETGFVAVTDVEKRTNWYKILDLYPGQFKAGLSQIRLLRPDNTEIVSYISLNPTDDFSMQLNFDADTVPSNTSIGGRGTIDAIINPQTYNPDNKVTGTRYLILEDINVNSQYGNIGYDGPDAWKNNDGTDFQARTNDIIEWNGTGWNILFNSLTVRTLTYITNSYTGIQYKWSDSPDGWAWTKSFEGIYEPAKWRLVL